MNIPYECGGDENMILSHSFHIRLFFFVGEFFCQNQERQISAVSGSVHKMASDNGKRTEKCNVR